MFYKIEKIFLYLLIIIFFSVIIFYYFSEENKIKIINNRLGSTEAIENEYSNLPIAIRRFEPKIALTAGFKGLDCFNKIKK